MGPENIEDAEDGAVTDYEPIPVGPPQRRVRVAASRPVGLGDGRAHGKSAIAKLRRLRLTLPPDLATDLLG